MLKRIRENEDGFTLIELMVVVLIISILIAIAIPTFLGAREGAQDRGAQSNLRNGLTAAKTGFADLGVFGGTDAATFATSLAAIEPSLAFGAPAVDGTPSNEVSVARTSNTEVVLAARSASGDCFFIREVAQGAGAGTFYGTSTAATCNAGAPGGNITGADFNAALS